MLVSKTTASLLAALMSFGVACIVLVAYLGHVDIPAFEQGVSWNDFGLGVWEGVFCLSGAANLLQALTSWRRTREEDSKRRALLATYDPERKL
jgi:hypothetical protein